MTFFWKTVKTMRLFTALTLLSALIFAVLLIGLPYITSIATDFIVNSEREFMFVLRMLAIYVVIVLSGHLVHEYALSKFLVKVRKQLLSNFTDYFITSPDELPVSTVQNAYSQELNTVVDNYFRQWVVFVMVVCTFILGTAYAIMISPFLILFMAAVVGLTVLINGLFSKKLANNMDNLQKENAELNKMIAGVIPTNFDFKLYKAWDFGKLLLDKQTRNQLTALWANNRFLVFVDLFNASISFFVQMGVLSISLYLLSIGSMSLGETLAVLLLMQHIVSPLNQLMGIKNNIDGTKTLREKFEQFYSVSNSTAVVDFPNSLTKVESIHFNNLSFSYEPLENNNYILKNVNLKFESNKKYLILGKSGSGKSTLLKLILKKIIPSGQLSINDTPIENIKEQELYANTAYIKQTIDLVPVDIYQNVTLSPNYDKSKLQEIFKQVNLDISKFKDNAEVNENQDNFSGGEGQKIMLARLYYHMQGKNLLIFDEFTSALDIVNAIGIEKKILELENKTVINVTHRFSEETLHLYDQLIIVNEGEVVYFGEPKLPEEEIVGYLK